MTDKFFFNPHLRLSKNKTLELQSGFWQHWSYFDITLKWNRRTDHAGFIFDIQLFGFYFIFQVYDNRHFDYEFNCWEGNQPPITPETHPRFFNEDGTLKKFVSPGISTTEYDL